jgi:hypothetical protein
VHYRLGDNVVLKDLDYFEEYNGLEFTIIEIYMGFSYRVKRDGFDPIWVTARNFVQGE